MKEKQDKWVFIINPAAGNGFAGKYSDKVNEMIVKNKVNAETVFTKRKGHATQIAHEFVEKGFNHIIAVGGDGTINEIIHGIIDNSNVTLGIVAAGTGNDFIQILGFSGEFSENDWKIFFEKNIMQMDVGKCNDNFFLNGMGLGFDAQVAAENYDQKGEVKEGSNSKYLWHILKTLLFYKEHNMYSFSDGQRQSTKCFINTIAIGRRFAGQYFLTPKAYANDGLLDVCMIKELAFIERIKIFLKVPKGEHIEDKNVNYYQTDKLKLEFDKDVPHHLDGELFFSSKFDVSILPAKLNFIYNPYGNHYFKP
ncbi:diacylglycerol/lipid kinase family protein [Calditrichota bacterium]